MNKEKTERVLDILITMTLVILISIILGDYIGGLFGNLVTSISTIYLFILTTLALKNLENSKVNSKPKTKTKGGKN